MTVVNGVTMEWILNLASTSIQDSQLKKQLGVDVSASVSGWGMEAKVNGSYKSEDITTHTSTATKDVNITVNVAEPDVTIPDAGYTVQPFIYWARNGALTLDYAVGLNPGTTGFETFWGLHYAAHPDPAFILPWRLDVEKGLGLNPNLKYYCKSLRVSPSAPDPGDYVQITARVHNFSLKDTDGPVKVRFYLGHPDSGGTPIVGTEGLTDLSTPTYIPSRDFRTVQMYWVAPSGLGTSSRVYAVIDPDNLLTEIHEENNIGFVPIRQAGLTGVEETKPAPLPEGVRVAQNFPNPFNPTTVVSCQSPVAGSIRLVVYDLLGREVAVLMDETKEPGIYYVPFDATGLASGVYLCRMSAGEFVQVKKMLLLR